MKTIRMAGVAILLGTLGSSLGGCSVFNPMPPAYDSIEVVRDRLDSSSYQAADMPDYVTAGRWILMYLPNRGLDILDVFDLSLGAGPGTGIELHATDFVHMSYLNYRSWRLGMVNRSGGVYEEGHFDEWHFVTQHGDDSASGRMPVWATTNLRPFQEPSRDGVASVREVEGGTWDLGARLHFLIGAEAKIRPFQIFDLIVGLWGDDPAGDDYGVRDYPLNDFAPQAEVVELFVQAIDSFNEADLRQTLSYQIARESWLYHEGDLRRLTDDESGGAPPSPQVGDTNDFLLIGPVKLKPANYRDDSSGRLQMTIRCEEAKLRWGVPAEFNYTMTLFNRVLQRQQTFKMTLRIEETQWRIWRFREAPNVT